MTYQAHRFCCVAREADIFQEYGILSYQYEGMECLYCFNFFITNAICCDILNLIEFILLCLWSNQNNIMLSVQQNYVLLEDVACFRLSNLSSGYIFSMTHKITMTEIIEAKKTANQNIILSVQYSYIF